MPCDEVELSDTRACLGRHYFHVPGGITQVKDGFKPPKK